MGFAPCKSLNASFSFWNSSKGRKPQYMCCLWGRALQKLGELYKMRKAHLGNTMPLVTMEEILHNVMWPPNTLTQICQVFMLPFLLPQANGRACVDFGCTHPIDGLFWSLPIYLLGFFSKNERWVTDLIMPLYHFIFLGCHLPFCIGKFHITINCKKKFHMTNVLNEFFYYKHTNN
jgi:hypothetical protein